MEKKMTVFAEALADSRNYKNARVDGNAVGVGNARKWIAAVKAMQMPAYAIAAYEHDHMGDTATAAPCDKTAFFNALRAVLDLIGEVNGAKLFPENCASSIIAASYRWRAIDITPEMAHARYEMRNAKKALEEDDTPENQEVYDAAAEEVKRLEGESGNCKKLFCDQSESAFVKEVERLLGDAIINQAAKPVEVIIAEKEAKRQARREKTAAKRAEKKSAKADDAIESATVQALPHELAV